MERVRDYDAWIGYNAYDRTGDKVGGIDQIFYDDATGRPEWVALRTGWFGTNVTFAPIAGSTAEGEDGLRLAYDKDLIKDAPNFDVDDHLSEDEERALYAHYGFTWDDADVAGYGYGAAYEQERADLDFTNGDDAMTRSEEELRVGTERRESGRARLRKYVVTEHQQVTVPVSREEVRLEREPITDENLDDALSGPDITESEHEVITYEERPVVAKETVPKERVRLTKETITDTEEVGADVRKEQIELDSEDVPRSPRR
jgi:uncharacterized protein (TIGR02271 family)